MTHQSDISETFVFLQDIINERASETEREWIRQQEKKFKIDFQLRSFYFAFSSAPRFVRKEPLQLSQREIAQAEKLRKGFQPQYWNLLQLVRTYLLLLLPNRDAKNYETNFNRLYETADVEEQVTLYSALPLLPYPDTIAKRAVEGIRTNITDVFDAIALHNPFPKDFLDQDEWNQMILKAVFMQRPLHKIYGADERANIDLTRMLVDFAHERWAANRQVMPQLWRFVGPFLNENYISDIEKIVQGDLVEKKAGLLACAFSNYPKAIELLEKFPDIKKNIEAGRLSWWSIEEEEFSRA